MPDFFFGIKIQNMQIKITECPRDAMQGIHEFIPTEKKIEYLNSLLQVGFDRLDFGSFVSAKAIPQLVDTAQVLEGLDLSNTQTELLAIIANLRGAEDAVKHKAIKYLGFPFSISETFQQRNTNSSISESLEKVKAIQELCIKNSKHLLIYISMGFGNPYGDAYNPGIVMEWVEKLKNIDIQHFAIADTIGVSNQENIQALFSNLFKEFKGLEIGAHLHSTPETQIEKIEAAIESGCNRFDTAIKGFGGCPMAMDSLTGNMATEVLIEALKKKGLKSAIDEEAFGRSMLISQSIFVH